jgi:hypothetical protein
MEVRKEKYFMKDEQIFDAKSCVIFQPVRLETKNQISRRGLIYQALLEDIDRRDLINQIPT